VARPVTALLPLAALPVAAAALALRLARALEPAERAVLALGAALFAASALLAPQAPLHDAWTHYQHLRAASGDPRWLLDQWDRPGFTLLYAAPAALGWTAARLTSAVLGSVALAATMRAAGAFGLATPWAAGVLLLAQHDFFGQGSSTMTELPFAAAFAVALAGWAEGRPWVAAGGLAWVAITRPEGPLFAALGAAGLLARHRRLGPPALALAAFPAYVAAGSLAWGDPRWLVNGSPYRHLVAPRLDWEQLLDSFFLEALRRGQPPVLLVLLAAGVLAVVLARGGAARSLRPLLAPVLASFLLLTFLRIGEHDGWRESRYLVAIAPVLALLASAGLDAALERFPGVAPPALLAVAALGAAGTLSWHWRSSGAWPAGPPDAAAIAYALCGAAGVGLWLARRRVPARAALAALLVLPLAASPPGAFGGLRPDAASAPLPAAARSGPPATLGDGSAPWPTSSSPSSDPTVRGSSRPSPSPSRPTAATGSRAGWPSSPGSSPAS
jgi:hypothetical protein